jgi:chromosome segregation ATPase
MDETQQNTLDTSVYEEEIAEVEKEMESLNDREAELNELLLKFNPDLENLVQEMEHLNQEEDEIAHEAKEMEQDGQQVYAHLRDEKMREMRGQKQVQTVQQKVTEWEEVQKEIQEEVDELTQKAVQLCGGNKTKMEVTETSEFYGKRLTDIKVRMNDSSIIRN